MKYTYLLTVDIAYTVDMVCTVDMVYTVDMGLRRLRATRGANE